MVAASKDKKGKEIYQSTTELLRTKPVAPESGKKRATLYIDKTIYSEFQHLCMDRGRSISEVVQSMMDDVLKMEK